MFEAFHNNKYGVFNSYGSPVGECPESVQNKSNDSQACTLETETIEIITAEDEGIKPEIIIIPAACDTQEFPAAPDETEIESEEAVKALGLAKFSRSVVGDVPGPSPRDSEGQVRVLDPPVYSRECVGPVILPDPPVENPQLPESQSSAVDAGAGGPSTPLSESSDSSVVPEAPTKRRAPQSRRKRKRQRLLAKLLAAIEGDESSSSES